MASPNCRNSPTSEKSAESLVEGVLPNYRAREGLQQIMNQSSTMSMPDLPRIRVRPQPALAKVPQDPLQAKRRSDCKIRKSFDRGLLVEGSNPNVNCWIGHSISRSPMGNNYHNYNYNGIPLYCTVKSLSFANFTGLMKSSSLINVSILNMPLHPLS